MKINEKYIEALKQIDDWTTVSNWAIKVGELYPDLLEKANKEAANHKRPSTGLRELAARISSWISTGDFAGVVEVDESERPRKVRYLSGERKAALIEKDIDEDIEPLNREIADISIYLLRILQKTETNLEAAVLDKLKKNGEKYPVHIAKGKSSKYDQFE